MTRWDVPLLAYFRFRYPGLSWAQLGALFGRTPHAARQACTRYIRRTG